MNRIKFIKNQLKSGEEEILKVESKSEDRSVKLVTMCMSVNILSRKMVQKLYSTLVSLDTDNETKVIILTGNKKIFLAGADIKALQKHNFVSISTNDWDFLPVENIYYHLNKPLIAAVNGACLGGGFEFALSCDLIFASEKASFALPEHTLGLIPGIGGTQRLAKFMGYQKAMQYILTAKNIPLEELKHFGIVNEVFQHEGLIDNCVEFAKEICKSSLNSIVGSKKAIKLALETNLYAGLKGERYIFQGIVGTEDKREGIQAFVNKKKPEFSNK